MILKINEYDQSYYDGQTTQLTHNAGFGHYKRWYRNGSEFWKDIALQYVGEQAIQGKKVLELACAKGFVVQDLRELGVDAYGMDASAYAIGEATPEVAPYLTEGDIRTELSQYSNNEFDFVFSIRLFECLEEVDIAPLIAEINRISKKQAHIITLMPNATYYNQKTLEEWKTYGFPKNTVLAEHNKLENRVTK